jgi:hypothetical protein
MAEVVAEVAHPAVEEPSPVRETATEAVAEPLEGVAEAQGAVQPEVVAAMEMEEVAPVELEPAAEVEPAAAEAATESAEPVAETQTPTAPETVAEPVPETQKPLAPVVVMPRPQPWHAPFEHREEPPRPIVIRPTPETLPFSPPPASAGMPTFQEVQEAAGPPPISPYEPPAERPATDDQELKEFVANFQWTPPDETADELTMRSEAPVIDEEEPAEFHHPSFDDDEPPPATEPHPTGEEYYTPSHEAQRSRFLEISAEQKEANAEVPAELLGVASAAKGPKWWLWMSILALVAVFGGLGFWEGRAQGLHPMRGPVDFVREKYDQLRQKIAEQSTPPPVAPATQASDDAKKDEPQQPRPEEPPKPSATEAAKPAETTPPTQTQQTAAGTTGPVTAATETPKPIQAPPASKPSSKPQPGQQEFDNAMNAGDPTAAAAWLWKATSRGNPEAPVRLADMYIRGNGVPKSCEQALVLLRSAATKENAPARNRLAALYANGTCVVRDRVKAYQLMTSALAADPSSAWAKENQQVLWSQMTPDERAAAAQKSQ